MKLVHRKRETGKIYFQLLSSSYDCAYLLRKLAEALEIDNSDVTADTNLHYSPFLLDYAK